MKKIMTIFLFVAMLVCLFTGCGENTAGDKTSEDKTETAAPADPIEVDYDEGSELSKLTIKGGETVTMDDILEKMNEFAKKYGPAEWLVISPEIKHIKPQTEKTKDFEVWETGVDGISLRTTSLSPRDIYCLLNTLRGVNVIHVIQGDDVKKFYRDEDISKFYRYYFPDMKSQDGLYIADGILFGYEGKKTKLSIPDSVTAIAPGACSAYDEENEKNKIKSVTLSDSVIEIGCNAFDYQSIKELELGNSVRVIGEQAFYDTEIKEVRIPESVDTVGEEAFSVGALERVRIEGSTKNFAEHICYSEAAGTVKFSFLKGIKEAYTNIFSEDYIKRIKGKKPYYRVKVSWIPVNEADGYDICASVGSYYKDRDSDKYIAKKTVSGKTAKTLLKPPAPEYDGNLIYLEITPFKYINGKKVYGKRAHDIGEDEGCIDDDCD